MSEVTLQGEAQIQSDRLIHFVRKLKIRNCIGEADVGLGSRMN